MIDFDNLAEEEMEYFLEHIYDRVMSQVSLKEQIRERINGRKLEDEDFLSVIYSPEINIRVSSDTIERIISDTPVNNNGSGFSVFESFKIKRSLKFKE